MCNSIILHHRPLPRYASSSFESPTDHLRDLLQRQQQWLRQRLDTELLLSRKGTQFKDLGEEKAFSTPLTAEQLKQQMDRLDRDLGELRGRIKAEQARLVAGGYLAANADQGLLTSCLMSRLNPRVYPDKPLVRVLCGGRRGGMAGERKGKGQFSGSGHAGDGMGRTGTVHLLLCSCGGKMPLGTQGKASHCC